jgi:hypothetical protein
MNVYRKKQHNYKITNLYNKSGINRHGDVGANEEGDIYWWSETLNSWVAPNENPERLFHIQDILHTINDADDWVHVNEFPYKYSNAINTLEHLEREGRIFKGVGQTYGNKTTYVKWRLEQGLDEPTFT